MKIKINQNIRIIHSTLFAIILFCFLFQSCEESVEPQVISKSNSIISSDCGTAVVKSDGSLWGGPFFFSPEASSFSKSNYSGDTLVKNNIIKNVVSINLYQGIAAIGDSEGNIWYWGDPLFICCANNPVTIPQKIGKLPHLKSLIINMNIIISFPI